VSREQTLIARSSLLGSILFDSLLVSPSLSASICLLIGVFLGIRQQLFPRKLQQKEPQVQQDSNEHYVISIDGRIRFSSCSESYVVAIS
jgi:hypothetical protein